MLESRCRALYHVLSALAMHANRPSTCVTLRTASAPLLSPHRIGPRPEYVPSRLIGLVPVLNMYPLASSDWSPP
eukprot:6426612-Pyramimonas_sp.AAC.1